MHYVESNIYIKTLFYIKLFYILLLNTPDVRLYRRPDIQDTKIIYWKYIEKIFLKDLKLHGGKNGNKRT